ncbi:hypothetical protein PR202_ga31274 [Eleusine coracana subsp. coracana]|uniref:Vta1/callose synthase N-terminal domain-containing protein n=1 Tax=Eleusine coracana subsp. coracana TaxID=191504 RepID=A0AAV5DRV5_ELECO|nr:hypothetical protein PR202_ga31274 [Eleusine coracana subsp. coracana]
MASGGAPSGQLRHSPSGRQQRMLSRAPTRAFTMRPDGFSGEDGGDGPLMEDESELVPSSLAPIVPILRAANEIEEENPRVAYLCRFTAFEKAHTMDPNSSGRGVRQFKTYLLHRLEKDEQETKRKLASTDAREIQKFYEQYCKKYLEDRDRRKPEEMARYYQIASVLYDVLKTVTPEKYHAEIKAAVDLLRKMDGLPMPRPEDGTMVPEEMNGPRDLLDWLWQSFGFQVPTNEYHIDFISSTVGNCIINFKARMSDGFL